MLEHNTDILRKNSEKDSHILERGGGINQQKKWKKAEKKPRFGTAEKADSRALSVFLTDPAIRPQIFELSTQIWYPIVNGTQAEQIEVSALEQEGRPCARDRDSLW